MIHFAKHTQLFIHLFIHLSKILMNSIWCRVEDICPAHKVLLLSHEKLQDRIY